MFLLTNPRFGYLNNTIGVWILLIWEIYLTDSPHEITEVISYKIIFWNTTCEILPLVNNFHANIILESGLSPVRSFNFHLGGFYFGITKHHVLFAKRNPPVLPIYETIWLVRGSVPFDVYHICHGTRLKVVLAINRLTYHFFHTYLLFVTMASYDNRSISNPSRLDYLFNS